MYSISATFLFNGLVLLFTSTRTVASLDHLSSYHSSASTSQSNISTEAVIAVLREIMNLTETNLQFLYGAEYEDVVENLTESLSQSFIGQMIFENDGNNEALLQLLVPSPRSSLLVVFERPVNLIDIFHKIRKKMLKSHLAKWLVIMEDRSGDNNILEIEEFVNEGTHVTICKINSSGYCDLLLPHVDSKGVTRYADETAIGKKESTAMKNSKYYSLSGREIKVGTKDSIIFIKLGKKFPDGSVQLVSGVDVSLLNTLASKLNFTYKAYVPEDNQLGNLQPNGNVTGIIGMVARREVTCGLRTLGLSEARETVVDFAWYCLTATTIILSRSPKEISKSLAVLSPFQLKAWASIIVAVLCMGPIAFLFSSCINGYEAGNFKKDLIRYEFNMFRGIVNQGVLIKDASGPSRVIIIFWLLFCVIYTATYSGMLTAMFALPSYETPIDYLDDLPGVVKEGFTIGTLGDSIYEHFFKTSIDGIYKQTWHLFNHEDRSKSFFSSHKTAVRKVLSEKFVYIFADFYGRYFQRLFGINKLHISREKFSPFTFGFPCQTGSPVKDTFHYAMLRAQEGGLISKWFDDEFRRISQDQSTNDGEISDSSAITLAHLQAAFYLLYLGISVASIALLIEVLTFTR